MRHSDAVMIPSEERTHAHILNDKRRDFANLTGFSNRSSSEEIPCWPRTFSIDDLPCHVGSACFVR